MIIVIGLPQFTYDDKYNEKDIFKNMKIWKYNIIFYWFKSISHNFKSISKYYCGYNWIFQALLAVAVNSIKENT